MADIEAVKKQAAADVELVKQKARNAIEVLKRDIQAAKDEAELHKAQLGSVRHELENVRQESQNRAAQYEHKIAELSEAVRSHEGKISDERDEKVASLKAELTRAQDEIARLHHENQNLANAQASQTTGHDDSAILRETLKRTEEKLAQLKEAAKAHVMKLQAEIAAKEKERQQAVAEIERLSSKAALQSSQDASSSQDLAERFSKAEQELNRAILSLEESEHAKKAAEAEAAKLKNDLASFKEAAKHHVEKLQRELEGKKDVEDRIRKQAEEESKKITETLEAQIKALKEASANATVAASVARSVSSPAAPPSDALIRMNKENKDLQLKLDSLTKTVAQEREDFKAQGKASRETIERLTKESTSLKREVDTAKEEARLLQKDLEKTKQELKRAQDQKLASDPVEMQKRKDQEIQVYVDKTMKLEAEIRKEQSKNAELLKQIQRFDAEVARLTGSHLEKYNKLERELMDKREALTLLEEQNSELKQTASLGDQRVDEIRRKTREQFQVLTDQLEQTRKALEQAKQMEEAHRAELASLKRQSDKASAALAAVTSTAPAIPQPSSTPPLTPSGGSTSSATFKMLEEEKTRAEVKRKEAMDDLSKAKRDYNSAKREAIQLAEAVDRLRSGLNKAALQAGGNLALAADRCDDALRQCVLQVEAALAAVQARDLAKQGNPSQSAGLADDDRNATRHRQSSIGEEQPSSPTGKKDQEPEERLVNALNEAEQRLDEMTATLRLLLPKVRQVATIAVQDKKNPSILASICNLSAIMAKLFNRNRDGDAESGYTGLQMQQSSAQKPSRRGRVLPDTPGGESNFDLEEE